MFLIGTNALPALLAQHRAAANPQPDAMNASSVSLQHQPSSRGGLLLLVFSFRQCASCRSKCCRTHEANRHAAHRVPGLAPEEVEARHAASRECGGVGGSTVCARTARASRSSSRSSTGAPTSTAPSSFAGARGVVLPAGVQAGMTPVSCSWAKSSRRPVQHGWKLPLMEAPAHDGPSAAAPASAASPMLTIGGGEAGARATEPTPPVPRTQPPSPNWSAVRRPRATQPAATSPPARRKSWSATSA
jgi:hypothetical protein